MRPKDGVQRGSVMDFPSSNPGDPLTPGVGATKEAKRLSVERGAEPHPHPGPAHLLRRRAAAPRRPRGAARARGLARRAPRSRTTWARARRRCHLKVAFNWDIKPVHDVVARIPGAERPDEWVVRGNHHDAWVNGAEDPISGLVPLLEEARALGLLLKQGWKPKRTIVYCAWDGEEPMLLGSTEWAEAHADELRQKAVAYVNTDGNGRGYLGMSGSHTLEHLVNDVARDVAGPRGEGLGLEAGAGEGPRRRLVRGGAEGDPPAGGPAPGRPGLGQRLHRLHRPPRRRQPEPRLRRRGRRRHLPLDLRRLLLVHALRRHRLRLRPGARADGRPRRPAAGGRRSPALRVLRPRGHDAGVPEGPEEARRAEAGGDRRAQPPDRGRRLPGDERPAAPDRRAAEGGRPAPPQLRAARERGRGAPAQRRPLREGAGRGGGPGDPAGRPRPRQRPAHPERARPPLAGRPPAPAVVQAPRSTRRASTRGTAPRRCPASREAIQAEALLRGRRARSRGSRRSCRTRRRSSTRPSAELEKVTP